MIRDFSVIQRKPAVTCSGLYRLIFQSLYHTSLMSLRGCSYGSELVQVGGLARLGEMIFIPRSHGILYLSSIKKFVISLEKDYLIKYFLQ